MIQTKTEKTPAVAEAVKKITLKTDKLIQAKLFIGWWHGNHVAHGLEENVAKDQGGDAKAFSVKLKCMPPEYRDRLNEATRAIEHAWHNRTRPYEDGGWRLLQAEKYNEALHVVNELSAKRREVVDDLVAHYDEIVAFAKSDSGLGKAYEDGMIPPRHVLAGQFNSYLRPKPIPNATDARALNVAKETQDAIAQSLSEARLESETKVKEEMKGELSKFVKELLDRLNTFKEGNGSRYGMILGSLGEAARGFREMGLLENADELFKKAEAISEVTSKDIRKDEKVRKTVKKDLEDLNNKIEEAFA
jgi:hypothetical protein